MIKMLIKFTDKLFTVFLLVICLVVVLTALGWIKLLVVKSGSMTPAMPVNSLVLVIPKKSIFSFSDKYSVGQIISFRRVGLSALITHRIVAVRKKDRSIIYKVKGDANDVPDVQLVSQNSILGLVVFLFPLIGGLTSLLKSFWGLLFLIVLPASFVVLREVLIIQQEFRSINLKEAQKVVIPFVLIGLMVFLSSPAYALFNSGVMLDENSLSTKESFGISPTPTFMPTPTSTPTPSVSAGCGGSNTININGNGAGSNNTVNVSSDCSMTINQSNSSTIINSVHTDTSSGWNGASDTQSSTIGTGASFTNVDITSETASSSVETK